MSKTCAICKRGSKRAVSRSHSNIATLKRQYLNLQKVTYKGKQVKACAKCIKGLYRVK